MMFSCRAVELHEPTATSKIRRIEDPKRILHHAEAGELAVPQRVFLGVALPDARSAWRRTRTIHFGSSDLLIFDVAVGNVQRDSE